MNRDDVQQLKIWFADYCRTFYSDNPEDQRNIILKEEHTHNICANIVRIAEEEGTSGAPLALAEAIALFHDVGRFRQYRQYKTFKDSESINHAALGAQVLRESGVLTAFPQPEQDIIIQAVRFHNAFAVPEKLSEEHRFFLQLIRDADKLDIWRVFIEFYGLPEEERASAVGLGFPDTPECSPGVLAFLNKGEMINLSLLKTLNDFKLLQLSWVHDLNFTTSFKMVAERNIIDRLAAALPQDDRIAGAVNVVREFVERRLQRGAVS
ncbi:MAG: metal-dependent [Geobacteraceae bacterium]|nr:MAG: metal-dependent [Geobacteraceae bacterium]